MFYIHRFGHTTCTVFTLRSTKLTEDQRPTNLCRSKAKRRVPKYTNFYEYTKLTCQLRPPLKRYAKEVEAIMNEKKRASGHVTAVQDEEEAEDVPDGLNSLDEEDVQAINTIRQQQGKKPYRFNKGRSLPMVDYTNKKKFTGKCNYCQIPGHKQFEC